MLRIPNYCLKLKTGVPIMLLRNIDQANGLCNDTRLQVNELRKNVIGTTVITRKNTLVIKYSFLEWN